MMIWIRQGITVDQKEMYENCKRRLAIYNATPIEQYEKRKELLVDLLGPGSISIVRIIPWIICKEGPVRRSCQK